MSDCTTVGTPATWQKNNNGVIVVHSLVLAHSERAVKDVEQRLGILNRTMVRFCSAALFDLALRLPYTASSVTLVELSRFLLGL